MRKNLKEKRTRLIGALLLPLCLLALSPLSTFADEVLSEQEGGLIQSETDVLLEEEHRDDDDEADLTALEEGESLVDPATPAISQEDLSASSQDLLRIIAGGAQGVDLANAVRPLYELALGVDKASLESVLCDAIDEENLLNDVLSRFQPGQENAVPFFQGMVLIKANGEQMQSLYSLEWEDPNELADWLALYDFAKKPHPMVEVSGERLEIDYDDMETWAPPLLGDLMDNMQLVEDDSQQQESTSVFAALPRFMTLFGIAPLSGGANAAEFKYNLVNRTETRDDGTIVYDETKDVDNPDITTAQKKSTPDGSGNIKIDLEAERPSQVVQKPLDVSLVFDFSSSMFTNYYHFYLDPDGYYMNYIGKPVQAQILPYVRPATTVYLRSNPANPSTTKDYQVLQGFMTEPRAYRKLAPFQWDALDWVGELEREVTLEDNGVTYTGAYLDYDWNEKYKIYPALWTYQGDDGTTHYVTFDRPVYPHEKNNGYYNIGEPFRMGTVWDGPPETSTLTYDKTKVMNEGQYAYPNQDFVKASIEAFNYTNRNGGPQLTLEQNVPGKITVETIPVWLEPDDAEILSQTLVAQGYDATTYSPKNLQSGVRMLGVNRLSALKVVSNEYLEQLAEDGAENGYVHRVGASIFSSEGDEQDLFELEPINIRSGNTVTVDWNKLRTNKQLIWEQQRRSTTYPNKGLELSIKMFDRESSDSLDPRDKDRFRAAIFFADGEPSYASESDEYQAIRSDITVRRSLNMAQRLKDRNVTIYSIFLGTGLSSTAEQKDIDYFYDINRFMNRVSSNMNLKDLEGNGASSSNYGDLNLPLKTRGWTDLDMGPYHYDYPPVYPGDAAGGARGEYLELYGRTYDGGLSSNIDHTPHGYFKYAINAEELIEAFAGIEMHPAGKPSIIKDYIDPRFEVVDAGGGKSGSDEYGDYLYWEQIIDSTNSFKATIIVKPKDSFIGGYQVPTNGDNSGIYVKNPDSKGGTDVYEFPQPTVDIPYRPSAVDYQSIQGWVLYPERLQYIQPYRNKESSTNEIFYHSANQFFGDLSNGYGYIDDHNSVSFEWLNAANASGNYLQSSYVPETDETYYLRATLTGTDASGKTHTQTFPVGEYKINVVEPVFSSPVTEIQLLIGEKIGDDYQFTGDHPLSTTITNYKGAPSTIKNALLNRLNVSTNQFLNGVTYQIQGGPPDNTVYNSFQALNSYVSKTEGVTELPVTILKDGKTVNKNHSVKIRVKTYVPEFLADTYYLLPGELLGDIYPSNKYPKSMVQGSASLCPAKLHNRFIAAGGYRDKLVYGDLENNIGNFKYEEDEVYTGQITYLGTPVSKVNVHVRVPEIKVNSKGANIVLHKGERVKDGPFSTGVQKLSELLGTQLALSKPVFTVDPLRPEKTAWSNEDAAKLPDLLTRLRAASGYTDTLDLELTGNTAAIATPSDWDTFGDWYVPESTTLSFTLKKNGLVIATDVKTVIEVRYGLSALQVLVESGKRGDEEFFVKLEHYSKVNQKNETFYFPLTVDEMVYVDNLEIGDYTMTVTAMDSDLKQTKTFANPRTITISRGEYTKQPDGSYHWRTPRKVERVTYNRSTTSEYFTDQDSMTNKFN